MKGIASHWVWVLAGLLISSFLFVVFFNLFTDFKRQYYQSILVQDLEDSYETIGNLCYSPDGTKTSINLRIPYTTKGAYMGLQDLLCFEGEQINCRQLQCHAYINTLSFSDNYLSTLKSYENSDIFIYSLNLEKINGTIQGSWDYVGPEKSSRWSNGK